MSDLRGSQRAEIPAPRLSPSVGCEDAVVLVRHTHDGARDPRPPKLDSAAAASPSLDPAESDSDNHTVLPHAFTLVLDGEHLLVGQERPAGHVWVERKATGIISGPDFVAAYNQASMALPKLPPGAGLVIDSRSARGNNDPSFESAIADVRRSFFPRFARRAILIQSAIGHLQAERIERHNDSGAAHFFTTVEDALAYIRGEN